MKQNKIPTRAKTKKQLIENNNKNFLELLSTINNLSERELNENFKFDNLNKKEKHWKRDKNIRDVVVHILEWQKMLINFVTNNLNNITCPFLPTGYNWKNYTILNDIIWEKHQNTKLAKAIVEVKENHLKINSLIENLEEEQLFTKKYFSWTGTTNLASYFISSASSHYIWAITKIKLHKKLLNKI